MYHKILKVPSLHALLAHIDDTLAEKPALKAAPTAVAPCTKLIIPVVYLAYLCCAESIMIGGAAFAVEIVESV